MEHGRFQAALCSARLRPCWHWRAVRGDRRGEVVGGKYLVPHSGSGRGILWLLHALFRRLPSRQIHGVVGTGLDRHRHCCRELGRCEGPLVDVLSECQLGDSEFGLPVESCGNIPNEKLPLRMVAFFP